MPNKQTVQMHPLLVPKKTNSLILFWNHHVFWLSFVLSDRTLRTPRAVQRAGRWQRSLETHGKMDEMAHKLFVDDSPKDADFQYLC